VIRHTTVALSLLSVRGEHLIRALDVNLVQPRALTYPIFDSTGSIFQGDYYTIDSFAGHLASIRLDAPSRNSAPSTNSRAPPPAITTEPRFPSTAA
jgi:hypothetical protein